LQDAVAGDPVESESREVLGKFCLERVMAAADEKANIIDCLLYLSWRDGLQCDFRSVAVVDAVVSSLEEVLIVRFHLVHCICFGLVLSRTFELAVLCRSNPEYATFRPVVKDEGLNRV
jgi:hypothetical protein